jgi:CRP-like cAMP-binding protein
MTKEELMRSIPPKDSDSPLAGILKNMPDDILNTLALSFGQPDSVLAYSGDDFRHIYILLDGKMRLSYELNTEFTYTFAIVEDISILGETETFTQYPVYKSTITCATSCKYLVIPKAVFLSWMKKDNIALLTLTSMIAKKYSMQVRQDRTYLSASSEDRFIYLMIKYYESIAEDGVCTITTPKEYLADEICVSNKTISRNIAKLKSEGLLTTKGHHIIIRQEQYDRILKEHAGNQKIQYL